MEEREHGLSVIPKAKPSERQKRTKFPMRMGIRDVIREDISNILKEKPKDFEDFLKLLEEEGYEVKKGKHLAICGKKQKRFIRFRSLGEDFSEESIRRVIVEEKVSPEGREKFTTRKDEKKENRRIDLLIDIQEKMAQGKSGGYIHWAKKHNVKQLAESILFLQQNHIRDKETLDALVEVKTEKYDNLLKTIKDAEEKMEKNKVLKNHIINYIKTKDTYIAYRKAGYSKKFFEEHREDILLHKAAKEAFSKLSERKIPKVKDLNEEFAKLISVKKKAYGE